MGLRPWEDIHRDLLKVGVRPGSPDYSRRLKQYREKQAAALAPVTDPEAEAQPGVAKAAPEPGLFAQFKEGLLQESISKQYAERAAKRLLPAFHGGTDPETIFGARPKPEPMPQPSSFTGKLARMGGAMAGDPYNYAGGGLAKAAYGAVMPRVAKGIIAGTFGVSAAEQRRLAGGTPGQIAQDLAFGTAMGAAAPVIGAKVAPEGAGLFRRALGIPAEGYFFGGGSAVNQELMEHGIPDSSQDLWDAGGRVLEGTAEEGTLMTGLMGILHAAGAIDRGAYTAAKRAQMNREGALEAPTAETTPGMRPQRRIKSVPYDMQQRYDTLQFEQRKFTDAAQAQGVKPEEIEGYTDIVEEMGRIEAVHPELAPVRAQAPQEPSTTPAETGSSRQTIRDMRQLPRFARPSLRALREGAGAEAPPVTTDTGQAGQVAVEGPIGGDVPLTADPQAAEQMYGAPAKQLVEEGVATPREDGRLEMAEPPPPPVPPEMGPPPEPLNRPGTAEFVEKPAAAGGPGSGRSRDYLAETYAWIEQRGRGPRNVQELQKVLKVDRVTAHSVMKEITRQAYERAHPRPESAVEPPPAEAPVAPDRPAPEVAANGENAAAPESEVPPPVPRDLAAEVDDGPDLGHTVESLRKELAELNDAKIKLLEQGVPREQHPPDLDLAREHTRLKIEELELAPPEVQDVVAGTARMWMRPFREEGTVPTEGELAMAGVDLQEFAANQGLDYYRSPREPGDGGGEYIGNPRMMDRVTMATLDRAGRLLEILHGEGNAQKPLTARDESNLMAVTGRNPPERGGAEVRTVLTDTPARTRAAVKAQPETLDVEVRPADEAIPDVLDERASYMGDDEILARMERLSPEERRRVTEAEMELWEKEAVLDRLVRGRPDEAQMRRKAEPYLAPLREKAARARAEAEKAPAADDALTGEWREAFDQETMVEYEDPITGKTREGIVEKWIDTDGEPALQVLDENGQVTVLYEWDRPRVTQEAASEPGTVLRPEETTPIVQAQAPKERPAAHVPAERGGAGGGGAARGAPITPEAIQDFLTKEQGRNLEAPPGEVKLWSEETYRQLNPEMSDAEIAEHMRFDKELSKLSPSQRRHVLASLEGEMGVGSATDRAIALNRKGAFRLVKGTASDPSTRTGALEARTGPIPRTAREQADALIPEIKARFPKARVDPPSGGKPDGPPLRIYIKKPGKAGKTKLGESYLEFTPDGDLRRWTNVDKVLGQKGEQELISFVKGEILRTKTDQLLEDAMARERGELTPIDAPDYVPKDVPQPAKVRELRPEDPEPPAVDEMLLEHQIGVPKQIEPGLWFLGDAPNGRQYAKRSNGSIFSRRGEGDTWRQLPGDWTKNRAKVFPDTHEAIARLEARIPTRGPGERGSLMPFGGPPKKVLDHTVSDPEINAALNIRKREKGLHEAAIDAGKWVGDKLQKLVVFAHEFRDDPGFRNRLRLALDIEPAARVWADREIERIVEPLLGLRDGSWQVVERVIILRDAIERSQKGLEGWSGKDTERYELAHAELMAKSAGPLGSPVRQAIDRFFETMRKVRDEEIALGNLPKETANTNWYFHHELMQMVNVALEGMKGLPGRFRQPMRGWAQKAKGSRDPINTDVLAVTREYLAKVKMTRDLDQFAKQELSRLDVAPYLTKEARKDILGGEHPKLQHGTLVSRADLAKWIPEDKLPPKAAGDTFMVFRYHRLRWSLGAPKGQAERNVMDFTDRSFYDTIPESQLPKDLRAVIVPKKYIDALNEFRGGVDFGLHHRALQIWKRMVIDLAGVPHQMVNIFGDMAAHAADDPRAILFGFTEMPTIARVVIGDEVLKKFIKGDRWKRLEERTSKLRGRDFDLQDFIEGAEINRLITGSSFFGPTVLEAKLRGQQSRLKWETGEKRGWHIPTVEDAKRFGNWLERHSIQPYETLAQWREAWLRVARALVEFDRINRGLKPRSRVYSTAGLDPQAAAFKIARQVSVDYGAMPFAYRKTVAPIFPFMTWYYRQFNYWPGRLGLGLTAPQKQEGGVPPIFERDADTGQVMHPEWKQNLGKRIANIADPKARLQLGLSAFATVVAPHMAMWLWNNEVMDHVEKDLKPYMRNTFHINLPWKDSDGRPSVLLLPTGLDVWLNAIGGAEGLALLGKMRRGEIEGDELQGQMKKLLDVDDRLWNMAKEVGELSMLGNWLWSLARNRDTITGQKVYDERADKAVKKWQIFDYSAQKILPFWARYKTAKYRTSQQEQGSDLDYWVNMAMTMINPVKHPDPVAGRLSEQFDYAREYDDVRKDWLFRYEQALGKGDTALVKKLYEEVFRGMVPGLTPKHIISLRKNPNAILRMLQLESETQWDKKTPEERERLRQTIKDMTLISRVKRYQQLPKQPRMLGQLRQMREEAGALKHQKKPTLGHSIRDMIGATP